MFDPQMELLSSYLAAWVVELDAPVSSPDLWASARQALDAAKTDEPYPSEL